MGLALSPALIVVITLSFCQQPNNTAATPDRCYTRRI
jgi:hypothetical protein